MNVTKDLTKEPPRSPRVRIGGYALLARMADKGRASLAGSAGSYHFDCPVDNLLFGFKGVKGTEVAPVLKSGASDQEIAAWLNTHGDRKTSAEVKAWSDEMEASRPYDNPDHREWFVDECHRLGLKPETTTLFDFLEADDRDTFGNPKSEIRNPKSED
jgi:hypothetical protein